MASNKNVAQQSVAPVPATTKPSPTSPWDKLRKPLNNKVDVPVPKKGITGGFLGGLFKKPTAVSQPSKEIKTTVAKDILPSSSVAIASKPDVSEVVTQQESLKLLPVVDSVITVEECESPSDLTKSQQDVSTHQPLNCTEKSEIDSSSSDTLGTKVDITNPNPVVVESTVAVVTSEIKLESNPQLQNTSITVDDEYHIEDR